MMKGIKFNAAILILLSATVFMHDTDIISLFMVGVSIYLYECFCSFCKGNEGKWSFVLIGILFIPQNIIMAKRVYDSIYYSNCGVVTIVSLCMFAYLFIFSAEQIVFGCMHMFLRRLERGLRKRSSAVEQAGENYGSDKAD